FMLELLAPRAGDKIFDVGSGSGWTVALLADIVGKKGEVWGIERILDLVDFGKLNLKKYDFTNKGIASIRKGDGYKGLPEFAPFDKIIIAASGSKIPFALKDQLKIGGRLVMPIGDQYQSQDIVAIAKNTATDFSAARYPGFIFVPLIKET
ncbi:protein-L-isoaspartate O-methyltransferase, partial [bacterium]|nr:protein-L-isoaspartate O-methyltransferase [bacterium]